MTKKQRRSLSVDGIPIDAKEWTEDDWRDLNEALETVKRRVSKRHAREDESGTRTYQPQGKKP